MTFQKIRPSICFAALARKSALRRLGTCSTTTEPLRKLLDPLQTRCTSKSAIMVTPMYTSREIHADRVLQGRSRALILPEQHPPSRPHPMGKYHPNEFLCPMTVGQCLQSGIIL